MVFNGVNLSEQFTDEETGAYFIVNEVRGRGVQGEENTLIGVAGMDGAYLSKRQRPVRYLEVDITLKGVSFEDLRRRIDRLSGILDTGKEIVPITFEDESDRTYYGKLDTVVDRLERAKIYQATLTFVCPDPYKYGPEKIIEPSSDIFIVENNGTADANPIIELTATQKATFAMISNGDNEYNLIGRPADVDEQIVDEKTIILSERGATLKDWYIPSGKWSGSFTTTGDAIVIGSWGTGEEWHGPALMKEINTLDDYEIEMYVYVRTEQPTQTFRVSTNLFDENMNEIGMLRLWDKTTTQIRKVAEARLGKYIENYLNYFISDRNYNLKGQRVWGGIIRIKKEGDMFTFYIARVTQGGRHTDTLTQTYVDTDKKYAGRLKFIRFDIATYGTTGTPNEIRIENIKVTKLATVKVDQTPYILYPGDVVTFDHKNDDILINGEPRNDLKNFGGSFFKLKKGDNTLVVTPEDTFNTKVRFRDKYR